MELQRLPAKPTAARDHPTVRMHFKEEMLRLAERYVPEYCDRQRN